MRTNKAFMFNEEKIAEEIIRNGFEKGIIDYGKMYVVAKYFREKYDYGAVRLEREIIDFCKSVDPNFNPITQAEYIKKWVKSAMEYNLRKINVACQSLALSGMVCEFACVCEKIILCFILMFPQ